MSEINPNDKKLVATEFFDGVLKGEELRWFEENALGEDPVVRDCLEAHGKLRAFVRSAPRAEPPRPIDYYWQNVRARALPHRERPRWSLSLQWLELRPARIAVLAMLFVALAGAWWWAVPQQGAVQLAAARPGPGDSGARIEQAISRQPGLYTSVFPARRANVIWIDGLEYLPPEFVLR